MAKNYLTYFLFLVLCTTSTVSLSQETTWWKISKTSNTSENLKSGISGLKLIIKKESFDKQVEKLLQIQSQNQSTTTVFPDEKGNPVIYEISRSSVLHPDLAFKFPNVLAFKGYAVNNPGHKIRFSYHKSKGLNAHIEKPTKQGLLLKTVSDDQLLIYNTNDEINNNDFECVTDNIKNSLKSSISVKKDVDDGFLRKYRLALSVSGNYAQYFLDGSESNDLERKEKVLTAMITTVDRVNAVFERDFGVTLQLIASTEDLIYLDPNTDPYTQNGSYNQEIQQQLDNHPSVGPDAYDVGHLFHRDGRVHGNAGCIACVCTPGQKGSAFTAHERLDSYHFDMIVAHELGHQFGGYHVQSSSACRSGFNSEVEPGSGSTIMGYAGICPANVQNEPDDYFNYVNIRDVAIWTIQNSDCAEKIDTNNNVPIANAGTDYIIPASTPFALKGQGSDSDNDLLTYCWEQNDPEDPLTSSVPTTTRTVGPMFRSLPPVASPVRYFPKLEDLISNNTPTWEVLPSISRSLTFALTVRDNAEEGGQVSSDQAEIEVDGNAGPFQITSQQSPEKWMVGEPVTITWDVAGTNTGRINEDFVDIVLSTDGGYTYTTELLMNTENDGEATFTLPYVETSSNARFMVKASDNIFFTINRGILEIESAEFSLAANTPKTVVCQPDVALYEITYKTYLDFEEEVALTVEGLPQNVVIDINPTTISGSQQSDVIITLSVSQTENLDLDSYEFFVRGLSTSGIEKKQPLSLEVFNEELTVPTLTSPANETSEVALTTEFLWTETNNTSNYSIEIADSPSFSGKVASGNVPTANFTTDKLISNQTYYWRVKSLNVCGESNFSEVFSFTTVCTPPTNFEVTAFTTNSIALTWENEDNNLCEIVYGPKDFEIETGTKQRFESNTAFIENLSSLTSYDFYVRSLCGTNNASDWVGPLTGTTSADYCNGDRFYDTGGEEDYYQNNENYTITIAPDFIENRVKVNFIKFNLENGYDYLRIFDGPDISSPQLHTGAGFTGSVNPGIFISSHTTGSLTFQFISDVSVTYPGWEAEVICEPKPNCEKPTEIELVEVAATHATITWKNDADSLDWTLTYRSLISGNADFTTVIAENNQVVITDLSPITTYEYFIQGNCVDGGTSDQAGPFTFTTPCGAMTAPFLESFDDRDQIPDCWVEFGTEGWRFNTFARYDAENAGDRNRTGNTNYAYISTYYPHGPNEVSTLITVPIDITELAQPSLQFSVFSVNNLDHTFNTLNVQLYDGSEWHDVFVLQENTISWRDVIIDLREYTITGPIKVRFHSIENSSGNPEYNTILIDEIKVDEMPSCLNPYALRTSTIKGSFANITWESSGEENNWEIQYGRRGFQSGSALTAYATEPSFQLENLEPLTDYEVYVRAVCGIGDTSEFMGPLYFQTICNTFEAPFSEDFSSYNSLSCWENDNNYWIFNTFYDNVKQEEIKDRTVGKRTNYAYVSNRYDSGNRDYFLTSPFININTLENPSLKFSVYSAIYDTNISNELIVELFDGHEWSILYEFEEGTNGWKDIQLAIPTETITDDIQLRFKINRNSSNNTSNYILLDDIIVDEFSDCQTPYHIEIVSLEATSLFLDWQITGAETQWEIVYGDPGFNPYQSEGQVVNTNLNTQVSGLLPFTNYDLYVRSTCDDNRNSEFLGPVSFKTRCEAFTTPYIEHFAKYQIPDCWNTNSNNNWNFGTVYDPEINQYIRDYTQNGGTYYLSNGNYSSNSNETFYLDVGSVNIENLENPAIKVALNMKTGFNGENETIKIEGWVAGEWQILLEANADTAGWQEFYVDLKDFSWSSSVIQTRIGFISNYNRSYGSYALLDDLAFVELPDCIEPYRLTPDSTVTANTVTFTWQTIDNPTEWEVQYGEEGFALGEGLFRMTTTPSAIIEDLTNDTRYDLYVRSKCDSTNFSEWAGPITMQTSSDYCNGDRFFDSGGEFGDYVDNERKTTVINPGSVGNKVQLVFNSFRLESCCDYLEIFDGPDRTFPRIGRYNSSSPGTIVSTHSSGSLTVFFYSDGSVTSSGWDASVSCISSLECLPPANLSLQLRSTTEVQLDWDINSGDEEWEVNYGNFGFTVGNGTSIFEDRNHTIIQNLNPEQTYQAYVRTVCEDNQYSEWTGPITFSGACLNTNANSNELIVNGDFECDQTEAWTSYWQTSESCQDGFKVTQSSANLCGALTTLHPRSGDYAAFATLNRDTSEGYFLILEQRIKLPYDLAEKSELIGSFDLDVVYDFSNISSELGMSVEVGLTNDNREYFTPIGSAVFGKDPSFGTLNESFEKDVLSEMVSYAGEEILIHVIAYIPEYNQNAAVVMIDNISLVTSGNVLNTNVHTVSNELKIVPNPNNGTFTIYTNQEEKFDKLEIVDITGKVVTFSMSESFKSGKNIQIDQVQPGMYFMYIYTKNGVSSKKIIVE